MKKYVIFSSSLIGMVGLIVLINSANADSVIVKKNGFMNALSAQQIDDFNGIVKECWKRPASTVKAVEFIRENGELYISIESTYVLSKEELSAMIKNGSNVKNRKVSESIRCKMSDESLTKLSSVLVGSWGAGSSTLTSSRFTVEENAVVVEESTGVGTVTLNQYLDSTDTETPLEAVGYIK